MRQNLFFFFSGAGKFCLAHGLGQLTSDVKSYVRTLNFRSDVIFARKTQNDVRKGVILRRMSKNNILSNNRNLTVVNLSVFSEHQQF